MYSSSQLVELFVVLCTADYYRYDFSKIADDVAYARSKSGPVRPDSMPTPLSVHIKRITYFLVPTIYIVAVVSLGFHQPRWMNALALPEVVPEGLWKNAARVLACVVSIALQALADEAYEHLGHNFRPAGVRHGECVLFLSSGVVQTGPYARVRHPLYSLSLLQATLWSLMFWSYAPLFTVVATAAIFAVKISIQEGAILRDDAVKEEYAAYMRKVPQKLVPYVW